MSPEVRRRILTACGYLLLGFVCFIFYGYLYTSVFKFKLPKTLWLEKENAQLLAGYNTLDEHFDEQEKRLLDIQMRDNAVYRSIFGMEQIPQEVRNAGLGGGAERYSGFRQYRHGNLLASSVMRMDILSKKAAIQSRSFDEVELLAKRADEMAACIPNISPVDMHLGGVDISSYFGSRVHPIFGDVLHHHGIDIRGPMGLPVYATADGRVVLAQPHFLGYGNCVVIDHGFGYKTRYAHLRKMFVEVGRTVSRGECIASMGRSGRATGVHLHYEVLYHNKPVNPVSYLDDLSGEEYRKIVKIRE